MYFDANIALLGLVQAPDKNATCTVNEKLFTNYKIKTDKK